MIFFNFSNHQFEPDPFTCYPYTSHDYDRIGEIDYWLNGVIGFPMALGSNTFLDYFRWVYVRNTYLTDKSR